MERNEVNGILVPGIGDGHWHTVTRADVNKLIWANSPLYYAIRMQSVEHVKALLEMGADPSITGANGTVVMDMSVSWGGIKGTQITGLLLEHGGRGRDALGYAMLYEHIEQSWLLIDHGHRHIDIDGVVYSRSARERTGNIITTRDACRESARATCALGRRAQGLRGNVDLWRLVARHVWSMRRHCSDE